MDFKNNRKSSFLIITVFLCAVFLLADCSSVEKTVPVQEKEPAAFIKPQPEPEPTLKDLAAALNEAWKELPSSDSSAGETPLFTAPAVLPAGDRLARKGGTALGGFLADAERGFLEEHGIYTDFAFLNAELIRAGLPEGPVTKQDIERVLPFGQKICIAEMDGSRLIDLFAYIGALPQGSGGFAQVSDGVSYTLTFDETGFNTSISKLVIGKSAIIPGHVYRVALNDFTAAGGSGYSFFLRNDILTVQTEVSLSAAIADYCSTHADSLYMKQGERITIHGGITE